MGFRMYLEYFGLRVSLLHSTAADAPEALRDWVLPR